jgi:hypothetical protein
MSKTTLRKRISLVAVSALCAGLLSVAAVPSANAANIAGNAQAVSTSDRFNVATLASATGAGVITSAVTNTSRSLGLVYKDDTSTTAQTATVLSTGTLVLYTTVATTASIVVSGGTLGSTSTGAGSGNDASLVAVNGNLRSTVFTGATSIAQTWSPGAVGTYTISLYKGNGTGTVPTATIPAQGTLVGNIVVTAVAASAAGTYSAALSGCNLATESAAATGTDVSGSSSVANAGYGYINFALVDVYGSLLAAGYPLVATATNGAIVNIGSTIGTSAASTSVSAAAPQSTIVVAQPTANAPVTTTVTLTYNGTVVCTKTLTIRGEVASLKVTPKVTQQTSANSWTDADYSLSGGVFYVDTLDSAGNKVIPTSSTVFSSVAATIDGVVTAVSIGTAATGIAATDATGLWPLSSSLGLATCSSTAGTNSALKMTYQNPSGTIITSPAFSVRCAGAPYTYTASWDKASYAQGDIATLTVQFKDIKGNNAASVTTGTTAVITSPQMTIVNTIGNAKKANINGQVVHTYTVGTTGTFTEGSYNALVDYPTYTAAAGAVQTVPYKVASGTNTVSNADVLKSIVALIASINKQIQALQKLILKR